MRDLLVRTHDRASSASLVLVAACPTSHKCPMLLVGLFRSVQLLPKKLLPSCAANLDTEKAPEFCDAGVIVENGPSHSLPSH